MTHLNEFLSNERAAIACEKPSSFNFWSDLDPLRQHDDFTMLMAELDKGKMPPPWELVDEVAQRRRVRGRSRTRHAASFKMIHFLMQRSKAGSPFGSSRHDPK
jgi:hypothetical protein